MKLSNLTRLTIYDSMKSGNPFQKDGVEMRPLPNNQYSVRKADWPTDILITCPSWDHAITAFERLMGEGRACNG